MQGIGSSFRLFLFIPLLFVLILNIAYITCGILLFVVFKNSAAFYSTAFVAVYIAVIILLNICLFGLIVILSNKFIKSGIVKSLNDLYDDIKTFYEDNKNGFESWSQRIINYPIEVSEISKYFHNTIAYQMYDLHNRITIDPLTGLRTSIILRQDLEQYPNHVIAVLNLSNFKEINSFYGVRLADEILYSVANILKNYFKDENYLLYRIHGDDFAILWINCTDRGMFIDKLNSFLEYLGRKEILIDSYTYLNITATIGIAFSYDSAKYSMVNAIMALHHAKEYKNPIVVYNRNLPILNTLKNNIQYTEIIYHALKNNDVIPFYQKIDGIQDYLDNKKTKYEALMRIEDKEGHIIPPGLFLEIAKRSNAYSKLSRLMIENSFKCLSQRDDCIFSINLALEDMISPDFLIWFMDRIVYYKLEGRIIAEITEQESVEDFDSVSNFIANIKELGVKVALDDFGSGYSTFSVLMKLPIDFLKIDGSLIKNIDKDNNARVIVQTIVQFTKQLNIYTIAEFVSSKEIYDVVKSIGIDFAQGYYVGKPMKTIE
ncbi:MAG: EAL domain-containing protein [Helicobacteraceae bacterium]|nr:EAL domain-containing protein [Helicobacteraceae bacterium]